MKKFACLTAMMIILYFTGIANADTVYLQEIGVNPSEVVSVHIPVLNQDLSVYAGEYILRITSGATIIDYHGFCIDPAYAPSTKVEYWLQDVQMGEEKYAAAAWLFNKYLSEPIKNNHTEASYQLAIWEVVFDSTPGSISDGQGSFYVRGTYDRTLAENLIDEVGLVDLSTFDPKGFVKVVNPETGYYGGGYQDYMIHVPEPSGLLLLVAGLLGVGAGIRRNRLTR